MSGRTYEQVLEQVQRPLSGPKLDLTKKLIVHGRQSKKIQITDHPEAYEQQTVRQVEYGQELGWTLGDIVICYENKRKDGKWRDVSAALRIDQRPLREAIELIERDEAKTLLTWAVDRLFRDPDMIQPATFVTICRKHHVIVLTNDDYFDFNNPKRDDGRRFRDIAQAAADYNTKHVKGRMIPAKNQVARRGEYDGRCLPTGFMVFKGEKKPQAYTPQIEVIRSRIFKRFKELDGQFNLLWREIAPIRDLFPPYPKNARGVKGYMKEGPFGITRDGLIGILTNPAYIGYWYFKEKGKTRILIPNIYPIAVNEDDFWFAFNNTSKTTTKGEKNELRTIRPQARFDRVGTIPAQALLDGIVTSPLPGKHVYVLQMADKPNKAEYAIQGRGFETEGQNDDAYILVRKLDIIFEQKLKYRLRLFQAMEAVREKSGSGKPSETSMYEYLKTMQEMSNQELVSVDSQIVECRTEIGNIERVLELFAHTYDNDSIIKMGERLAKLNVTLKELESKEGRRIEEKDLKEAASLITEASVSYDKMLFEKKQKLLRHVTTNLELSILAPRWLLLKVAWSPFLGITVEDLAFIWHPYGAGGKWSDEENASLRSLYESEDRDTVQQALFNRSWQAIKHRASELEIRRSRQSNNTSLSNILSYQDQEIMQLNELEYTEEKRRVWWKSVPVMKDATSPRIYPVYPKFRKSAGDSVPQILAE